MSLVHDGFNFVADSHGPVRQPRPAELPVLRGQFFGVKGESHITGEPWGVELVAEVELAGHADIDSLYQGIANINDQAGKLTGTLTQTIKGVSRDFPKCTFLGFAATEDAFLDGSGVNGWIQKGRLLWRQRA